MRRESIFPILLSVVILNSCAREAPVQPASAPRGAALQEAQEGEGSSLPEAGAIVEKISDSAPSELAEIKPEEWVRLHHVALRP
jgi:hypothetical protein